MSISTADGKILERQKDKDTAEWKYRINGKSLSGGEVEVVTKLSPTGKLVIITVYVPYSMQRSRIFYIPCYTT
jgi:hypothetical protein